MFVVGRRSRHTLALAQFVTQWYVEIFGVGKIVAGLVLESPGNIGEHVPAVVSGNLLQNTAMSHEPRILSQLEVIGNVLTNEGSTFCIKIQNLSPFSNKMSEVGLYIFNLNTSVIVQFKKKNFLWGKIFIE